MRKHKLFAALLAVCTAASAQTEAQRQLTTREPIPDKPNGMDALYFIRFHIEPHELPSFAQRYRQQVDVTPLPDALNKRKLHYDDSFRCPDNKNISACAETVRADLPRFQAALNQHSDLLGNIDKVSQYSVFVPTHWDWQQDSLLTVKFPPYDLLIRPAVAAAVTEWQSGQTEAALNRSCRQIQTGKTLIRQGALGLITPIIGAAIVRSHSDIVTRIVAEQPSWAARLPESCQGAWTPLPENDLSLCTAFKTEYTLSQNTFNNASDNEGFVDFLLRLYMKYYFSRQQAEHLNYYCSTDARQQLQQDTRFSVPKNLFPSKVPFLGDAHRDYSDYVHRMQDMHMHLNAVRAALELHHRPTPPSDAEIRAVLDTHSTPSRRLHWNAAAGRIEYPAYHPSTQVAFVPLTAPKKSADSKTN